MATFMVKLKIEDCYSIEVKARNAEAAENKAIEILAAFKDPINTPHFNGSSGFEVYETEKLK